MTATIHTHCLDCHVEFTPPSVPIPTRHGGRGLCRRCYLKNDKPWRRLPRGARSDVKRSLQEPDPVAVERLLMGTDVHVTSAELAEAIARLDDRGLSELEIAGRLQITTRTVQRHRARRRQQAA